MPAAPAAAPRAIAQDRGSASDPTAASSVADDVLVFQHTGAGFTLVGSSGDRAGWVGIVDLGTADDGLVGRAWRRGTAERLAGRSMSHVAGPYYARHAAAVPVGQNHVVLFGGKRPILAADSQLVRLAARELDASNGVSADKLLADELELVDAIRALMAYRPETVRDTVRHIATVAGRALSCEVAVVRVETEGEPVIEGLDLRSSSPLQRPDVTGSLGIASLEPRIEQAAPPDPDIFGLPVASHLTLPLAGDLGGALALGHTIGRPRGFTSLCQRIGRAIADASELLISQAQAREALAAERDLLTQLVRVDPLTGGANRRAWDDEVAAWRAESRHRSAFVLSCDLDGLKAMNDRFGHAAGDALIRGASNMLRSSVRNGDLVARIGGDEFVVLLLASELKAAQTVVARVRRAERAWRVTEHALTPSISIGLAEVVDGDLEAALAVADQAMYANKRRRSGGPAQRP